MECSELTNHISLRPAVASYDLEAQEIQWWNTFADLEDRYAWVQTPALQTALRGHYLREIVKAAGNHGAILDLGCGTGWLSLALARAGATNVTGVDFSASQIGIANAEARRQRLAERVRFQCADATMPPESAGKYDCVIAHGFLHHLFGDEIRETLRTAHRVLNDSGKFIVLEPVLHPATGDRINAAETYERRIEFLQRLANRGVRIGFRRVSKAEQNVRNALAKRNQGLPPHGPSPKEMPFAPGELEEFLKPLFVIRRNARVMARSHHVTQEWLLRAISHPISSKLALPFIAWLAARWDRAFASQDPPVTNAWLFTMLIGEKISPHAV